jgi:hypothetical protein
MARRAAPILVLFVLPALLVASGCGEARIPVFPVTGKLSFQGKPPVGARVVLHAADPSDIDDVAPSGAVQSDGTFAITAYEPGDGAPQGDYVATVQWFKVIGDAGGSAPGPNVLPKMYASPATSPIKVSVAGGPVQIPPIVIK